MYCTKYDKITCLSIKMLSIFVANLFEDNVCGVFAGCLYALPQYFPNFFEAVHLPLEQFAFFQQAFRICAQISADAALLKDFGNNLASEQYIGQIYKLDMHKMF